MRIDLGCGFRKKKDFYGIDIFDYTDRYGEGNFMCGKIPDILIYFEDGSIDEVYAKDFIEHIPQDRIIKFFNEIYRILKIGGIFEIYVPPTQSPDGKACRGAFCDPTHVSFWNDMSFRYYDMTYGPELSKSYGIKCDFEILENKFLDEVNQHVILQKRG